MANALENFIKEELSRVNCGIEDYSIEKYSLDGFFCAKCGSKDLTFFGLVVRDSDICGSYHDGVCESCGNKLRVYLKTVVNFKDLYDEED